MLYFFINKIKKYLQFYQFIIYCIYCDLLIYLTTKPNDILIIYELSLILFNYTHPPRYHCTCPN